MINKTFFDIDELIENIKYANLEMFQLTKATTPSVLISKKINDLVIQYISINATVEHSGAFQYDYYSFTISNKDTKEIHNGKELSPNSFIISEPLQTFSGLGINKLESITINIKKEIIYTLFGKLKSGIYTHLDSENLNRFYQFIRSLITKKNLINDTNTSEFILYEIVYIILNMSSNTQTVQKYYEKFNRLSSYIHQHINKNMTVTELSKKFGITDRTIRNIFSKNLNISPKQYHKSIKLNYLKRLICEDKKYKITNAMNTLNLEYQSLITKDFKSLYGYTPKKFISLYFNNKSN
jgi:AraC-like DNA-binding protein